MLCFNHSLSMINRRCVSVICIITSFRRFSCNIDTFEQKYIACMGFNPSEGYMGNYQWDDFTGDYQKDDLAGNSQ